MARVYCGTCVFILLGVVFLLGYEAEGIVVLKIRSKLEALPGRKCLNLHFTEPCQENYQCSISMKAKLIRKTAHSISSKTNSVPSNKIMKINDTYRYILCMFDSAAGENVSCCNDISRNPSINIATGYQLSLSYDQEIGFDLEACNDTCMKITNFFKAVLPWYDPCYFGKPCKNLGTCQPAVNSYTCLCRGNWNGTNCTILKDMTYHTGKCLNYSSNADVKLYMKTVEDCKTVCSNRGASSCKAFQFKPMVSGNLGNCTLRDANSLEQKVGSCDSDLYEFTNLLIPPSPESPSAPTAAAAVALYLLLAFLTFFLK